MPVKCLNIVFLHIFSRSDDYWMILYASANLFVFLVNLAYC